jgi:hypothetical protein
MWLAFGVLTVVTVLATCVIRFFQKDEEKIRIARELYWAQRRAEKERETLPMQPPRSDVA